MVAIILHKIFTFKNRLKNEIKYCATSNNSPNADTSPFQTCLNNCDNSFNLTSTLCGLASLSPSERNDPSAYAYCVKGASESRDGCYI